MRLTKRYGLIPLLTILGATAATAGPLDDLQPGHWYAAPNSHLDNVAADPPGTSAVINAWNGGAYDTVNDRLIIWGGGHTDYSGNEIYVFDIDTLTWTRWDEPSANTNCNFSNNEYPDGAPCAMHTYDYVDFHPGSQSFVLLGGASPYPNGGGGAPTAHMYSFANNAWRRGADRTGGTTLQGATSAYDPNRDVFWVLPAYDQKFAKFDPDANGGSGAWTQYSTESIEIDAASAIDPVHDLFVTVDGRGTHRVLVHDLTNPSAAPVAVTTSGDDAPEQHGQLAFDWDSATGQFVSWIGGTSVYTLTPPSSNWKTSPWVWEQVTVAPDNTVTPTAPNPNGTYSRWRYVPSKNLFVVVNKTSENVYFYKLSAGGGDPPPGDPENDWQARATAPGVVYANDFRTEDQFLIGQFPDSKVANVTWDTRHSITGGHSIRFDILKGDSENSGNWRTYLQPSGVAFANGDEFYVQYRLYTPAYHLGHVYLGGGGWKTSIISEYFESFTNHEVVLGNTNYHGYPRGYYRGRPTPQQGVDYVNWDLNAGYLGCGGTDPDFRHQPEIDHGPQTGGSLCEQNRKRYGGLYSYGTPQYGESALPDPLTGAAIWQADAWQTILQHVKVGHFDSADSTVEVWFAADGQPYSLLYRKTDAILGALEQGEHGYEAIWLTPFDTGKDPDPTRQDTFMNYDQLIVSTQFIDAPGVTSGAPTVQLGANPTQVVSGGSTTLTWSSTNATSCTATGNWNGSKAISGSQTISNITENKHYVLTCTGAGGSASDSVDVTVSGGQAPTVNLAANPTSVGYNGSSTLTWSSTNATSCTASGNWSGSKAVSGSQVMSNLTADKHYVLTCTGTGGSGSDSADVAVGDPPPSVSLSANPTNVAYDGSTTLTWSSTNATSCTASGNWSGSKAISGSQTINDLTADKHYVLTCTGGGGSGSDSADVNVGSPPAPTLSFTATETNVPYDGSTTLKWSSTNATSCTATGNWNGTKDLSGSEVRSSITEDKNYTLTCTGAGGSIDRSVSVKVGAPPPQVNLTADPNDINYRDRTTLSWSSTDAVLCKASGDWSGVKPASGRETTARLNADSTFALTCFGEGGRTTDVALVNVGRPPGDEPTIVATAEPSQLEYLGHTTITWTTTNTETCTASGAWSGAREQEGSEQVGPLSRDSVFTLGCSGPGGDTSRSITVAVDTPPEPPTLDFTVTPDSVPRGGGATITWASDNTVGCLASGGWDGARESSGSASTGPLTTSTTYMLTCVGTEEAITKDVTVDVRSDAVPAPELTSFSADPATVEYGGMVELHWSVTDAAWCTASGAWSGVKPASGTEQTRALSADSDFFLNCFNASGTATGSVTVPVGEPQGGEPVVTLSSDDAWVDYQGTPTLTWSTANADSCEASGAWSGTRDLTGSEQTAPLTESSDFTLTCSGPSGQAESHVAIAVGAGGDPWLELSATPSSVDYGGATQLVWSAANVDDCVASGAWTGSRPFSGSELAHNLIVEDTFTLTCSGPSGTIERSVTVSVGEPAAATLTLSADPEHVAYGGVSVLSWSGENLDHCEASGGWQGARTTNGIESTDALTYTQDFVLECTSPAGALSARVTVDVDEPASDDEDFDGLSDEWELYYFGDLSHDGHADGDGDGLDDTHEYAALTDPTNWDTDGDGSGDAEELYYGSSPIDPQDLWTLHRPDQPEVDASRTLALLNGELTTMTPFSDPDGDRIGSSEWQLATDESFEALLFDRSVLETETLIVPAGVVEKDGAYWVRTRQFDPYGLPSDWSAAKQVHTEASFPNDADGDETDDAYQVQGFADTNDDGLADDSQGIGTVYDAEGHNVVGFEPDQGTIHMYTAIANADLPDGNLYADTLTYGMFAFSIDGLPVNPESPASVQVTIYLPEAASALSGWYKYDDATHVITDFSAYARVHDGNITLNLVDGGTGDADGVVNGIIIDPSGPAIVAMDPGPVDDGGGSDPPPDDGGAGNGSGGGDGGGGGGGTVDPLLLALLAGSLARRRKVA